MEQQLAPHQISHLSQFLKLSEWSIGVAGALIDLVLALEIAVFAVAWKGRPVVGT